MNAIRTARKLFFITTLVVLAATAAAAADDCACNDRPPFVQRPSQAEAARLAKARSAELERSLREAPCDDAVEAAAVLGRRHEAAAISALLTSLAGPRCRVREGSAYALQSHRSNAVLRALVNALRDDDPRVRTAAASSLGSQHDPDSAATRALIQALADTSKHVRQAAAISLGDLGNPAARPSLTHSLRDPEKHVRQAAAEAIGKLRSN